MVSGWGEDGARGDWYANQDFNFKNLQVHKGDKLPSAWQIPQNTSYLKDTYGENCIKYKSRTTSSRRVHQDDKEEWVPARKEASGKKGK